jgi:hypothetical protein
MSVRALAKGLGLVLVVGAFGAGGTTLLLRPSEKCSPERRLDSLLGGGMPVCLGGSFAPLKRASDRGSLDLDDSGGGYFTLTEQGRTYTYMATGGLGLFLNSNGARWARVGIACVKGLADSAEVHRLSQRARADLGSNWERDTTFARSWQSNWKAQGGLRVQANTYGQLCLFDL